jgi:hypothetical protein
MSAMIWLAWLVFCWFITGLLCTFLWMAYRAYGKALQREAIAAAQIAEAKEWIEQAMMCSEALREIAVMSFMRAHRGTYQAWTDQHAGLGALHVKVDTVLRRFDTGDFAPFDDEPLP